MVNRLQITRPSLLDHFLNFLFHAISHLLDFHLLLEDGAEPIHARHVGSIIQSELRVIAEEPGYCEGVVSTNKQRAVTRRTVVRNYFQTGARNDGSYTRFDLFQSLHRK